MQHSDSSTRSFLQQHLAGESSCGTWVWWAAWSQRCPRCEQPLSLSRLLRRTRTRRKMHSCWQSLFQVMRQVISQLATLSYSLLLPRSHFNLDTYIRLYAQRPGGNAGSVTWKLCQAAKTNWTKVLKQPRDERWSSGSGQVTVAGLRAQREVTD